MRRTRSENRKTAALWLLVAAGLLLAPSMAEAGKKAKAKWGKKEPKVSVQPAKAKPKADHSASADMSSSAPSAAGVVNVNKATLSELCLLPGIGPKRAEQIVAMRHKKPFKSPKELLKIKGIGRKTLKKLLPYIAVAGETTLKAPVSGL